MYPDCLFYKELLNPFYIRHFITSIYDYDDKMPYKIGKRLIRLSDIKTDLVHLLKRYYDNNMGVFV